MKEHDARRTAQSPSSPAMAELAHPSPAMAELAARLEEAARRARRLGVDRLELRYQSDCSEVAKLEHAQGHAGDPDLSEERVRSAGISARAFLGGAIGHAACATRAVDRDEADASAGELDGDPFTPAIEAAIEAAVALARSHRRAGSDATAAFETEEEPARGHHQTPCEESFGTLDAPRLALAAEAARALLAAAGADGRRARAQLALMCSQRIFASSDGSLVTQRLYGAGGGLSLLVEANGEREERSYPMGGIGLLAGGGWERVRALGLEETVQALADEARALVRAPLCPAATLALILSPEQLCLQLHATVGLALEADRVLAEPHATSFVEPAMLGRFRYGSPLVNIVADATLAGGLGSLGWDDEGVPGRRTPLVQRGQLVGLLTTRRTAARLGLGRSGGCLRSAIFRDAPLVRITNLVLEPAAHGPTLEELIADTPSGLLVGSNRTWAVDDRLLEFSFSCEAAWEIRGGRRTRLLRRPSYRGRTPRFWRSCDAVGRAEEARLLGLIDYAKGATAERLGVSHGGPPARFQDVEIGAAP